MGGAKPHLGEFRSADAAVARSIAAMPKSTKLVVVLKEMGGTDAIVVSKELRGGELVLTGLVNRYNVITYLTNKDLPAAAPVTGNPDVPAVPTPPRPPPAPMPPRRESWLSLRGVQDP